MTVPYFVNEHQSDIRAIKPGWYGMETTEISHPGRFESVEMPHRNLSRIALVAADQWSVPNVEVSTSGRARA